MSPTAFLATTGRIANQNRDREGADGPGANHCTPPASRRLLPPASRL